MDATRSNRTETRRSRLAANDNEVIVEDAGDLDVEGHRLAANDSEIVVEGAGPDMPREDDAAMDLEAPGRTSLSNHGH